jgi:plasmid stabilization system protein ParE
MARLIWTEPALADLDEIAELYVMRSERLLRPYLLQLREEQA